MSDSDQAVGFKAHYFQELANLEADNFWFRARNQLISWAIQKNSPLLSNFLEIGCGTGFVLSAVSKSFPHAEIFGSEYFEEGLVYARQRLPKATFNQMDARSIPHSLYFDAIGAFDVLEHIQEDDVVLNQIYKALKPSGIVFITVPQHPWLWSVVDEHACHVRRYTEQELDRKVKAAGFEVVLSTSFVTILLPAMYISRMIARKKNNLQNDEIAGIKMNPWLNKLFELLLALERFFIRTGVRLPFGGSRLLVARKDL